MNDLEWYLDIGGKQSGPHAAKEIVDLVRAGKIPLGAQVTAARMSGDWVTAKDLVEAYDELYAKTVSKNISEQFAPFVSTAPSRPDVHSDIPSRPMEQLEKSKIIYLNQDANERAPDPTDALFHAIQAVREKSQQKFITPGSSAAGASGREAYGTVKNGKKSGTPPQLILILTLAAILGITVYGISILVGGTNSGTAESKKSAPVEPPPPRANAVAPRTNTNQSSGLLNSGGGGQSAAKPAPRYSTPKQNLRPPSRESARNVPARLEKGGGARYRDEMDPVSPDAGGYDGADVEGADSAAEGQEELDAPQVPVDPEQVLIDPYNPEGVPAGAGYPGGNGAPGFPESTNPPRQ